MTAPLSAAHEFPAQASESAGVPVWPNYVLILDPDDPAGNLYFSRAANQDVISDPTVEGLYNLIVIHDQQQPGKGGGGGAAPQGGETGGKGGP